MGTLSLYGVLIAPTTSAATAVVDLTYGVYDPSLGGMRQLPGSIELLGTLAGSEVISIERPLIAAPDPTNDSHWTQYYYRDEAVKLTPTNHSETSGAVTVFRLNKPITASAAGVRVV